MTCVWSRPKYFPKDSPALYCVNQAVWPSTFLMLCPPIHPPAQIILGKYHKREDFRIEVRLPSSCTNWGKERPRIQKNLISTFSQTNLPRSCLTANMQVTGNFKCSLKFLMTFYLGCVDRCVYKIGSSCSISSTYSDKLSPSSFFFPLKMTLQQTSE